MKTVMTNTSTQLRPQLIKGKISEQEKVIILSNLHLTNGVIASMLNRSEGSIRKFLFKNRITRTPEQVSATKFFAGSKMKGTNNGNYKHGEGNNPYYYKKKHAHKHRKKERARNIVYKAKRAGLIIQKNICEKCLLEGPTEFHHSDYNKPLEVQELCTYCHMDADLERQMKEQDEILKPILGDSILGIYSGNRPSTNSD